VNKFLLCPDDGVDPRYFLVAMHMFSLEKQLDLAQKQLDKSKKILDSLYFAHEMIDPIENGKAQKMIRTHLAKNKKVARNERR